MRTSNHVVSTGSTDVERKSVSTCRSMRRLAEEFQFVGLPDESLGQGSSGQVKRVQEKMTGQIYAMKVIKKISKSEAFIKSIIREVKIQRDLKHPHIIRLRYFCEDKDNVCLVLDWAQNGRSNNNL